ncbi:AT DNA binding protein [Aspergillus ellipticus CBS 707.79]|uniref:AT DNA binding protein n=1 Tax=Aspergillus ellipticus CBS 707.79 TaxID=1448320 RepID=A0A319DIH3_9EURO|nr:AT DNA binding protein [Aspergillus ellipticus CBS 707.79]
MSSRSPSSSPDILGPAGDNDYLISSPFVPFSGRQSFMSPANFRLLQSPRTAKGKRRSQMSLSPSKSAHSFKFNDVVLPASPSMKFNGQQRVLSPENLQPDGNVSPWRIRVTLEATQDEETNQGSPLQKRLKPSTTTMKVPLKDDTEQTPRRRRGRPRKSDIVMHDATPQAGSPGHTPGPGGTGQKRKRGRPRKSELGSDIHDNGPEHVDQEFDREAPIVEPERDWSPLNLAGDAGSDDDYPGDQAMDIDVTFAHDVQMEEPDQTALDRSSPRVTFDTSFDTPNVDNVDQGYMENDEYNLNSTPSKMPSPTRDTQIISPTNTLHAGRTPRPPRLYPTPTSSSVAEEDKTDQAQKMKEAPIINRRESEHHSTTDPTDEHREFDSIMESEGFSMVSLDTLPSAKQHELNTASHSQATKSALKPFLRRESNGVLKRRASALNHDHGETAPAGKSPLKPRLEEQSPDQEIPNATESNVSFNRLSNGKPASTRGMPESSTTIPPLTSAVRPVRRPLSRLIKIIRAGFALEGPLRNSKEGQTLDPRSDLAARNSVGKQDSTFEPSRKRLETLFRDFNPDLQQELRAGLAFGHELAKRRRQTERERNRQVRAEEETNTRSLHRGSRDVNGSRSPQQELDETARYDTPGTFMRRRMEEWQREREAISREIQMANSSQVIVINSDENDQSNVEDGRNADEDELEGELGDELEYESESIPDEGARIESEPIEEGDEDDGYEDIWQQEAHSQGNHSDRSSLLQDDQSVEDDQSDTQPKQDGSSPWKSGWTPARHQNDQIFSPAHWTSERETVPFLGRSRVKQLKEQDVDLTSLYRAQDTPKRSHYYYGKSSPMDSVTGGTGGRFSAFREQQEIDDHVSDEDRQSESYVESSPRRDWEDETFQIDPTTRLEMARQRYEPTVEDDEIESISGVAAAEEHAVQETTDITPERPRPVSPDNQASSWFQKITNFTPGWLRAPKPNHQGSSGEESPVDDEFEELPTVEPAHEDEEVHWEDMDETPRPVQFAEPEDEQQSISSSEPFQVVENVQESVDDNEEKEEEEERVEETSKSPSPPFPSDYFSNDHYRSLHRLYRSAKLYPERFPYHPAPGRSDIIGDWIWTSDGVYGVPVTELQFAIIDRFAQQLSRADLKAGGTGHISWTEAEVHKRLISIIIGEQIRQERKQRLHDDRPRAGQMRSRDAAYETWRI